MKRKEVIKRLKKIHPDMEACRSDEEGFLEMVLRSGESMSSSEFAEGSETKKLMHALQGQGDDL